MGRDVPLVDLQRAGKLPAPPAGGRHCTLPAHPGAGRLACRPCAACWRNCRRPATLPWEWLSLEPTSKGRANTFEMDGRFPVARADVASTDNSLVQWTLFSRDDESAEWQRRAPWIATRCNRARRGQRQQSAAQPLGGVHRDRYWKLVANPAESATAPTLRLGYQPEVLVFLSRVRRLRTGGGQRDRARTRRSGCDRGTSAAQRSVVAPTLARLEGSPEPLAGDAALSMTGSRGCCGRCWVWACWWWVVWRSACFGKPTPSA